MRDTVWARGSPQHESYMNLHSMFTRHGTSTRTELAGGGKRHTVTIEDTPFIIYVNRVSSAFASNTGEKVEYGFVTPDGSKDCGALIVNKSKKEGYIALVYGEPGCVSYQEQEQIIIPNQKIGSLLIHIMLEWCKLRGVTRVYLNDISFSVCSKTRQEETPYNIDLLTSHTLFYGAPWYYSLGFRFSRPEDNLLVEANKELHQRLLTNVINKKTLMSVIKGDLKSMFSLMPIDAQKQIYTSVYHMFDEHSTRPLHEFCKRLHAKHCTLYSHIHKLIFSSVGYKYPSSREMLYDID